MARHQLDATVYVVTSAAYFLTSALCGMRSSELAELTSGCRRQEERPGGGTRYRLVSRRIKGEAFGGTEDAWVVTEDVHQAIAIAEALTGTAPGERLFAKASNDSGRRYTALSSWVNGEYGTAARAGAHPRWPGQSPSPAAHARDGHRPAPARPDGRETAPQACQRRHSRGLYRPSGIASDGRETAGRQLTTRT